MMTQGAVEVPSNLPVSSLTLGPLYAPSSGMWDGVEKGWTLVQQQKKKSKRQNHYR